MPYVIVPLIDGVSIGVGVFVAVDVAVGVSVGVSVAVDVAVGVLVFVAVAVFVAVGVGQRSVAILSSQPPVMLPVSKSESSITYRDHVPFGFVPLKASNDEPAGAGAGAGKTSDVAS